MTINNFSKDELAIIYDAVKSSGAIYDVMDQDNKLGISIRNILGKIKETDEEITSPWYVHDNILD
ncbi:hypothetical protein ACIQLG_00730 [Terribacillus saccharophilus]|uniref:hypothetical protein n=1 Tax=Terribacillus saccharophilus TaxID=361277 RepID=UPI0037F1DCBF